MGVYRIYIPPLLTPLIFISCASLTFLLLAILLLQWTDNPLPVAMLLPFPVLLLVFLFYMKSIVYEIGDEGLRIRSLTWNILIPYREMEDVKVAPAMEFASESYWRAFKRKVISFVPSGGLMGGSMTIIDTTRTIQVYDPPEMIVLPVSYLVAPADNKSFITELKPRLKK